MSSELSAEVLDAVRGKRISRTGWARTACPLCPSKKGSPDRHTSFGLNFVSGKFYCFRCKARGKVKRRLLEGVQLPADLDVGGADEPTPLFDPPAGFALLAEEPARTARCTKKARRYLKGRGIGPDLWEAASIGLVIDDLLPDERLDDEQFREVRMLRDRVVVPVFNPQGDWFGYVARTYLKHERGCECFHCNRKYVNAKGMRAADFFYNHQALARETDDPVIVVEGCFDVLAVGLDDGVGTLGSLKERQMEALLDSDRPVCFVPDGDDWESGEWQAWRVRYEGGCAGFIRLPPRTDPDEVDLGWLKEQARRSLATA